MDLQPIQPQQQLQQPQVDLFTMYFDEYKRMKYRKMGLSFSEYVEFKLKIRELELKIEELNLLITPTQVKETKKEK